MTDPNVREYLTEIGRRGGKARLKTMTAKQRRQIAIKASRAAAVARKKKASTNKPKGK